MKMMEIGIVWIVGIHFINDSVDIHKILTMFIKVFDN